MRVTARGVRPVQPYQVLYEYYWLYGAVEPKTGEAFYLEKPALEVDGFGVFLAEFARSYADTLNVVILDGAGAHVAHALEMPENVALVFLPPYCPELNSAPAVVAGAQEVPRRLRRADLGGAGGAARARGETA